MKKRCVCVCALKWCVHEIHSKRVNNESCRHTTYELIKLTKLRQERETSGKVASGKLTREIGR